MTDHSTHGRSDDAGAPTDSDCPCRLSPELLDCASAGCGFCASLGPAAQIRAGFKRKMFTIRIKPDAPDIVMNSLARALIEGLRTLKPGEVVTVRFAGKLP